MENLYDKMPHKLATYKFSDGRELQVNSDKSEILRYPNGDKEFSFPDGRKMYYIARQGITIEGSHLHVLDPVKVMAGVAKKKMRRALRGY